MFFLKDMKLYLDFFNTLLKKITIKENTTCFM